MAVDPRQLYQQQAGPPLGPPSDPYADLESRIPVGGPILANVFRLLDTYSNAIPRRIFGSALRTPILGDALSVGADRSAIMRGGKERGSLGAFQEFERTSKVPFAGAIAETLTDPLFGLGPIAKAGAPLRAGIMRGARSALDVPEGLARGQRTIEGVRRTGGPTVTRAERATDLQERARSGERVSGWAWKGLASKKYQGAVTEKPYAFDAYAAKPGEDETVVMLNKAFQVVNRAAGGIPGRLGERISSSPWFQSSEKQTRREMRANYTNMFQQIERTAQTPILEFMLRTTGKNATDQELKEQLFRQGVATPLVETFLKDRKNLEKAADLAWKDKSQTTNRIREVLEAQGIGPIPPVTKGPIAQRIGQMEQIRLLGAQHGIIDAPSLLSTARRVYANDPGRLRPLEEQVKKFQNRLIPADPWKNADDIGLVISNAVDVREKLLKQGGTRDALKGAIGFLETAGNMEREQATASIPYLVANLFGRTFQMAVYDGKAREALFQQLQGMSKVFSKKGDLAGQSAAEQKRMFTPKKVQDFADQLGIDVDAELDPGISGSIMREAGDSVNSIIDSSKLTINTAGGGHAFPVLAALGGMIAGGPVGLAVGGITGKAVQKAAPLVYQLERTGDYVSRSIVWQKEVARNLHERMPLFVDDLLSNLIESGPWRNNYARDRDVPTPMKLQQLVKDLLDTNGFVSMDDMEAVVRSHLPGLRPEPMAKIKQQWADVLYDANRSGVDAAKKALIIPRTTNLDEKLRYVLVFHHFATRALPFFAEQAIANPLYTTAIIRQMAAAERESQYKGLPDRLDAHGGLIWPDTFLLGGIVSALYGAPAQVYGSPTQAFNPFLGFQEAQMRPNEEGEIDPLKSALDLAQNLGLSPQFVGKWLLSLTGLLGNETPSPDFFRHGALARDLPFVGTDINAPVREGTNLLRRLSGQEPGNYQEYAIRKRIRELAVESGMDPQSPAVRNIESNPNHPMYVAARGDVQRSSLLVSGTSVMSPVPMGLKFIGDTEQRTRQSRATAVREEGLSPAEGSLFARSVDVVAPHTTTYRGLNFTPPNAPGLQTLLSGRSNTTTDPQQIAQQYLTWAFAQGIKPEQVWQQQNIQRYFATMSKNIRANQAAREGR